MSVADRLRVESEQALGLLQESHRAVEEQLAQALIRQQEKDGELESLRSEHRNVCLKLRELTLQQQQERAELDALRNAYRVKDVTDCDEKAERQDSDGGEEIQEVLEEKPREVETDTEAKNVEKQREENETNQEVDAEVVGHDPEEANESGSMYLRGKGVAEGYLRSLAALEKKKEGGRGQKDPRRIVMLCERSW